MKKFYKSLLLCNLLIGLTFNLYAQGELWGMTTNGGPDNLGSIFKMNADVSGYSVKKLFTTNYPGYSPNGELTYSGGKLYGMTVEGGSNNLGMIFEYDPASGVLTKKIDFLGSNGNRPVGKLTFASNGKFYAMTNQGGLNDLGTLFEYDPVSNVLTTKINFAGNPDGANPESFLIEASNGKLYGMTRTGGNNNSGILFEYNIATGVLSKKIDFTGAANGSWPYGGLMEASNGKLYGMTIFGGTTGKGTLFEYDPASSILNKKAEFSGVNGQYPQGSLVEFSNGKIYGMTNSGGVNNKGTLFEYDPIAVTLTKKVDFAGPSNGSGPQQRTLIVSGAKLYGVTDFGGSSDHGVLFEFDPVGGITKKADFSTLQTGAHPQSLIKVGTKFYGTASSGGTNQAGTLFEYDITTSVITKKVDFLYSPEGAKPLGSLIVADNKKLYGMTTEGGVNGAGVLFEIDPVTGSYVKKADFSSSLTGSTPRGSLFKASNGKLYGMTSMGGVNDKGTLFEYDPSSGTILKKIDFSGAANGEYPRGGLIQVGDKLYGMTEIGGVSGEGVLFEYDIATNTLVKKKDFSIATGGGYPLSNLIYVNGKFYGLTDSGGSLNKGTLFEYDLGANTLVTKVDFTGAANGSYPDGSLIQVGSKLVGLASSGGANGDGAVFEYNLSDGSFAKKADFDFNVDGSNPKGSLILVGGNLYGMTNMGGGIGEGTLFEYNPVSGTVTNKYEFTRSNGSNPSGDLLFVKANQSITFNTLPDKTITDANFALAATASSGLTLTYSSSNTGVATVSGNTVTIVGAGTTTITATQAGNDRYYPATDITQTLTVLPAPTIASFTPSSAGSGVTVTIIGTDFTGATAVKFGGTAAASFTVESATTIKAVVVAGATGDISVTTPGGTATKTGFIFFALPANNFKVATTSETCKTSNNGSLSITAVQNLNYTATLIGNSVNKTASFTTTGEIRDLVTGTYNLCITVASQPGYKQCFDVVITEPKDLSVYSVVDKSLRSVNLQLNGGNTYQVELNGKLYTTTTSQISLPLEKGNNTLRVMADKACQGVVEKRINLSDDVLIYPNPFEDHLNIQLINSGEENVKVEIRTIEGKLAYVGQHSTGSGSIDLALAHLNSGTYLLKLTTGNSETIYKILKK